MTKALVSLVVLIAIITVGSGRAQQAEKPTGDEGAPSRSDTMVDGRLSEIGDITIIGDTDKLVAEARDVLSKISKDIDAKERASEFKMIRSLRPRLNKRSLELRALLESFRQYKLSLKSQIQEKQNTIQTNATISPQIELMAAEAEKLKQQLEGSNAELDGLKRRLAATTDQTDKQNLTRNIRDSEINIKEQEAQIHFYEQTKAKQQEVGVTTQKEIDGLKNTVDQIDNVLSRAQKSLRNLDEISVEMDDQSNALLQTDILNINYTDRSTYIFAILVGAVIIGFFGVALRSDKIREAIFTGESGIQFVTLFSLVIAIILFGVLKILEGKELAALLGGLSGYILGRGSHLQQGNGTGAGGANKANPNPNP